MSEIPPKRLLQVFLCHASADKPAVRDLYRYLRKRGISPWLDAEDLIPGQNWQIEIPKAIAASDAIVICLSKSSVDKEGYVQKEIKFALDKALEMPEGRIFLIPGRLEECETPHSLSSYHWVNLFEADGYSKLMKALKFRAAQLERAMVEGPKVEESHPTAAGETAAEKTKRERIEQEDVDILTRAQQERDATVQARLEFTKKVAQEQIEREAAEKAEREKVEREAAEQATKEQARLEVAEKVAREQAAREAAEKAERERLEQEAAKKTAKERAEREAAEKAKRLSFEPAKLESPAPKSEISRKSLQKRGWRLVNAAIILLGFFGSWGKLTIFPTNGPTITESTNGFRVMGSIGNDLWNLVVVKSDFPNPYLVPYFFAFFALIAIFLYGVLNLFMVFFYADWMSKPIGRVLVFTLLTPGLLILLFGIFSGGIDGSYEWGFWLSGIGLFSCLLLEITSYVRRKA